MTEQELLEYEAPAISEWVSFGWGQEIIAYLLAKKINYKLRRFKKRQKRKQYIKNYYDQQTR